MEIEIETSGTSRFPLNSTKIISTTVALAFVVQLGLARVQMQTISPSPGTATGIEWVGFDNSEASALVNSNTVSVGEQFARFFAQWREDTAFMSSLSMIVSHPAYRSIITMGPVAIPLILRELQHQPDHWAWALSEITGVNPVPEEHAGQLAEITSAWLRWGRAKGYI